MRYPTMIHQQVLSSKYQPTDAAYSYQNKWKLFSTTNRALSNFEVDTSDLRRLGNRGLNIPAYDHFQPSSFPLATVKVATIMVALSESDKRSLVNIKELGNYNFRQAVLDFMCESEYPYMCTLYGSIFQLHLYSGSSIMEQSTIEMDADGNIYATEDLDLRKTYHLRISLVANWDYLSDAALRRLKAYPDAARLIITAINQSICSMGGQKPFRYSRLPVGWIRGVGCDYNGSFDVVTGATGYSLRGYDYLRWCLVETLFISAHSLSELNSKV